MSSSSFNTQISFQKFAGGFAIAAGIGLTIYAIWRGRQVSIDTTQTKVVDPQDVGLIGARPEAKHEEVVMCAEPSSSTASSSSIVEKQLMDDPDYGKVFIQEFTPTWLEDYPQIIEHIESEHLLHVKGIDGKGRGLTWHESKFTSDMDPRFNPEAHLDGARRGGFQMRLGYFVVPAAKIKSLQALSLSASIQNEMCITNPLGEVVAYRFFVHPQAYDHFRSLHGEVSFRYVSPEESEYLCTPTSSYRSLAIRKVQTSPTGETRPAEKSVPFIVKLGVGGDVLGSDRWLSHREIVRSVQCQQAFDGMGSTSLHSSSSKASKDQKLYIFAESMGIHLVEISSYSPEKPSGILIREFPTEFLEGKCRIVSMAALMSVERSKPEHSGIGHASSLPMEEFGSLPLVFEIMEASIRKGLVKTPMEFFIKFFVHGYVDAIESVTFVEGMTIEPHSQNLCIVLENDLTPIGFAYRDHGGIWVDTATRGMQGKDMRPFYQPDTNGNALFKTKGAIAKAYIGSFSWFYRYQVMVKMLNVATQTLHGAEMMPPPKGAPFQIGVEGTLEERNLQPYLQQTLIGAKVNMAALKQLERLSLTFGQYNSVLTLLDGYYLSVMNKYFDMDAVQVQMIDNALPSAEGGSGSESIMTQHKGFLGKYRYYKIDSSSIRFNYHSAPPNVRNRILKNLITSFENQDFEALNVKDCMILEKGICLMNEKNEIVGFSPFATSFEKGWYQQQVSI